MNTGHLPKDPLTASDQSLSAQRWIFRAIRNTALVGGAVSGLRHDPRSGDNSLADLLTPAERERLERYARHPWTEFGMRVTFRPVIRLGPLLVIVVAYMLGYIWAPSDAGSEYFSAAAQVIPVLLLALAVESRLLDYRTLFRFEPTPVLPPEARKLIVEILGEKPPVSTRILLAGDTAMAWINGAIFAISILGAGLAVLVLLGLPSGTA
jgi:hypothetical protein